MRAVEAGAATTTTTTTTTTRTRWWWWQLAASWVKKGEVEKYGARGHGSVARRGIQRIEVADDHNTRIPGYHSLAIHSAQRAGANCR
ncbi:hypothetical protein K0M31_009474 [Melipona bicolor]|uniref:Uncharacterized protein n=1 Tax=Melipona bicolor TaxID=60889 RepID=A0AA40FN54_9HYME|nr:hypothetical protein K0M31_009474 [Melipona bicolor]